MVNKKDLVQLDMRNDMEGDYSTSPSSKTYFARNGGVRCERRFLINPLLIISLSTNRAGSLAKRCIVMGMD